MGIINRQIIPTSNGSYQQLTPSGSPAYACIQANDGSYIYCTSYTTYQVSTFKLSADLIPHGSIIDHVVMQSRFYTTASGRCSNWNATLFGGVFRTHSSIYQPQYYDNVVTDTFNTAPDGTPWLREDLDNIEFGAQMKRYDAGGYTSYWEYLLVTVYYTPPTGGKVRFIGVML
jgi:hypothetical protein